MIICAGEALFDFISKEPGKNVGKVRLFEKRPGGAPLNVAVGLSRLGDEVVFMGKVSDDPFGRALLDFLESEGVSTELVVVDPHVKTTLAFVSLDERGKPSFVFYRERGADMNLEVRELPGELPPATFYHFGSISMTDPPSSEAFVEMFHRFREKGVTTSFDPNVRPNLVSDEDSYRRRLSEIFHEVDVLKLSKEDLEYLEGSDFEGFVRRYGREDKATFLTLGERGSVGYVSGKLLSVEAFKPGEVVDTTGCGDAYMAGLIHVFEREKTVDPETSLRAMEFASVVAGLTATGYGAASSMPRYDEVSRFLGG